MAQISVIVPVYKVEPYLRRCVDSILAQTFTDFELILVDDGSPDNCGVICDEYAAKDSRVHVIHQENGGLSAARNAGIDWAFAHSDSEWISFVDSDDWVHVQYLEKLFTAAENMHVCMSMCYLESTSTFPEKKLIQIENPHLWEPESVYALQYESAVVAWGKLIRKHLFERIRFPVGQINEDLCTTYKYFFTQPYIAVIESRLYYYFQRDNSIMHSKWSPCKLDAIDAQESALAFFKENHYSKAEKRQLESFMVCLAAQWWQIRDISNGVEHKKVLTKLQRKLRKAIAQYCRNQEFPIESHEWIYNAAYPVCMFIYWTMDALVRKIKSEGCISAFRKAAHRIIKR